MSGTGGTVFTSEWAKTHPTDAWLLSEELRLEAQQEEVKKYSCSCCNNWYEESTALKPGWGICTANSDLDSFDIDFRECYETCMDWEPR